jgi:single-strand DNA-binding protein
MGRDPETRSITSGDRLANLSVATSEYWFDKNGGGRKEKTEWHSIVVWGDGLVKHIEKSVRKGDRVYIEGQLQTRKWQDRDGKDRYSTEIVVRGWGGRFLLLTDKRAEKAAARANGFDEDDGNWGNTSDFGDNVTQFERPRVGGHPELDDDIPF